MDPDGPYRLKEVKTKLDSSKIQRDIDRQRNHLFKLLSRVNAAGTSSAPQGARTVPNSATSVTSNPHFHPDGDASGSGQQARASWMSLQSSPHSTATAARLVADYNEHSSKLSANLAAVRQPPPAVQHSMAHSTAVLQAARDALADARPGGPANPLDSSSGGDTPTPSSARHTNALQAFRHLDGGRRAASRPHSPSAFAAAPFANSPVSSNLADGAFYSGSIQAAAWREERDALRATVASRERDVERLHESHRALQVDLFKQRKDLVEAQSQLAAAGERARAHAAHLQAAAAAAEAELRARADDEAAAHQAKIAALERQLRAASERATESARALHRERETSAALEETVRAQRERISALERELAVARGSGGVQSGEPEAKRLRAEIALLQQRLENTEGQLVAADEELSAVRAGQTGASPAAMPIHSHFQQRIAALEDLLSEREATAHDLRARPPPDEAAAQLAALQRQLAEHAALVAQQQRELRQREAAASQLRRQVPELEATVAQLHEQLRASAGEGTLARQHAHALSSTVDALRRQVASCAAAAAEASALRRQVHELEASLSSATASSSAPQSGGRSTANGNSLPRASAQQAARDREVAQLRWLLATSGTCETGPDAIERTRAASPLPDDAAGGDADVRVLQLQCVLDAKDRELAALRQRLSEDADEKGAYEGVAPLERQLEAADREIAALKRRIAALEGELVEARACEAGVGSRGGGRRSGSNGGGPDADVLVLQLQCVVDAKDRELELLRRELSEAVVGASDGEGEGADASELAMADREIAALRRRVALLEGEVAELRAKLREATESDGSEPRSAREERLERRRWNAEREELKAGIADRDATIQALTARVEAKAAASGSSNFCTVDETLAGDVEAASLRAQLSELRLVHEALEQSSGEAMQVMQREIAELRAQLSERGSMTTLSCEPAGRPSDNIDAVLESNATYERRLDFICDMHGIDRSDATTDVDSSGDRSQRRGGAFVARGRGGRQRAPGEAPPPGKGADDDGDRAALEGTIIVLRRELDSAREQLRSVHAALEDRRMTSLQSSQSVSPLLGPSPVKFARMNALATRDGLRDRDEMDLRPQILDSVASSRINGRQGGDPRLSPLLSSRVEAAAVSTLQTQVVKLRDRAENRETEVRRLGSEHKAARDVLQAQVAALNDRVTQLLEEAAERELKVQSLTEQLALRDLELGEARADRGHVQEALLSAADSGQLHDALTAALDGVCGDSNASTPRGAFAGAGAAVAAALAQRDAALRRLAAAETARDAAVAARDAAMRASSDGGASRLSTSAAAELQASFEQEVREKEEALEELHAVRQALEAAGEQLLQATLELQSTKTALEGARADATALRTQRTELEERLLEADACMAGLEASLDASNAARAALERDLQQLRVASISRAPTTPRGAPAAGATSPGSGGSDGAGGAVPRADVGALEAALAAARRESEERAAALAEAQASLDRAENELAGCTMHVRDQERTILALQKRLRQSEGEAERLRERAEASEPPGVPTAAALVEARQRVQDSESRLQAALAAQKALSTALEQSALELSEKDGEMMLLEGELARLQERFTQERFPAPMSTDYTFLSVPPSSETLAAMKRSGLNRSGSSFADDS